MAESLPVGDAWLPAERAADLNRYARLHPTRREIIAGRWLGPLTAVLAGIDLILGLVVLLSTSPSPDPLHPAAEGGAFLVILLGLAWSTITGRTDFSGAPSIQPALPSGAWPTLLRQITGREQLDPARADIALELAHQLRRRQQGQLAVLLWCLPICLDLAASDIRPLAILNVAVVLVLLIAAALSLDNSRRVTRFYDGHCEDVKRR